MLEHHHVIVVGAGPGGISVAAALVDHHVPDVLVIDKGEIGQAWLDYPAETHLLSESSQSKDENMIAGVSTSEVFPHIPHPSHALYQKYLRHVAEIKKVPVKTNVEVIEIDYDAHSHLFVLVAKDEQVFTCEQVVWAAGLYSTPNEKMDCEGCYIHYARMPYLDNMEAKEITVVGSANGASGVVLELAKPGRLITLVVSHEYAVPEPVDCLWKEQMQFIKGLEKQGLVKIVENFRVKDIYHDQDHYVLESEKGDRLQAAERPIVCTGFLPNIEPIRSLVASAPDSKGELLEIDDVRQSLKQHGLYLAGALGKKTSAEGFIAQFRDFGEVIAKDIAAKEKRY